MDDGPAYPRRMTAATFDTHAAVKALTQAGLEPAHAEAIADTVRVAVSEGAATKEDIANVRADVSHLRADVFRALWLQAATIIAVVLTAILAAVIALINLLP